MLSQEQRDKAELYEGMHESLRAVPDLHEKARMELYAANVSRSSAGSYDRSMAAIATRRVEAGGPAGTQIAKRSRRLVAHRELKKQRKELEDAMTTANLLAQDGQQTFKKFRGCCNTPSNFKTENDEVINYLGFEDRWQNDQEYRSRPPTKEYLQNKQAALHRDTQAALYFRDNFHGPIQSRHSSERAVDDGSHLDQKKGR